MVVDTYLTVMLTVMLTVILDCDLDPFFCTKDGIYVILYNSNKLPNEINNKYTIYESKIHWKRYLMRIPSGIFVRYLFIDQSHTHTYTHIELFSVIILIDLSIQAPFLGTAPMGIEKDKIRRD